TAERGYAQLLGHGDVTQTRLAEERLQETRKQVIGAAGTDVGLIRKALAVGWANWLADLLEEHPDAEADLQALVQEIRAVLPTGTPSALPTGTPSAPPTGTPSAPPTGTPSAPPTGTPSAPPTGTPSAPPTGTPSAPPTGTPSAPPPGTPSAPPTGTPSAPPTGTPSAPPTGTPSASNHAVSADGDAIIDAAEAPGPEHPGALAKRSQLAYSIGKAGDAATARDQFAALLPVAERVFGPEHPDTLAARANLAYWIGQAGDAATP